MNLQDLDYEDKRIEKVVKVDTGWSVTFDDGWSFHVPKESPLEPQAGYFARMYPKGIGMLVRGLLLCASAQSDWVEVFYRTEIEQLQQNKKWRDGEEKKRQENLERNLADTDSRIAALPEPFKKRIHYFQKHAPTWRRDHEPYELFCCEQAVVFASELKTPKAITEFHKLDFEDQKKRIPQLSDNHSGNTFGASCMLAQFYLKHPDKLWQVHGALCPLVGCSDYGCYAGRNEEAA